MSPQGLWILWCPLWEPHLPDGVTGDKVLLQLQRSLPHPLSEESQGDPGAGVRPRPRVSGTLELTFAIHCLWQECLSLHVQHC